MGFSEAHAIERLHPAVIDGRAENIRYRQNQLQYLHEGFREQAESICSAIVKDTQASAAEAASEFYLAMDAVKDFYGSIDFEKEMKDEYLITTGLDNVTRRTGVGLVVIRPTTHTRFYSVICPLAAAIAAGNCVILELEDTLLNVDALLKEILPKALDSETFYISNQKINNGETVSFHLIDQTSNVMGTSQRNQTDSCSNARTIAIVDRTADIDGAAQAITMARFSFQGMSPYAPDLVIVNEFVKEEFFAACTRYASQAFAAYQSKTPRPTLNNQSIQKVIKEAEEKGHASSFGSSNFMLIDIFERLSPITTMKIQGRYLPILSCTGLVDAVFSQPMGSTFLAGYIFADPKAAKFLSQQLDCHTTYVNQIPSHLLVGPAAPLSHAPSHPHRYSKEMLSHSRPQYTQAPPHSLSLPTKLLSGSNAKSKGDDISAATLRSLAAKPLPPTGQPLGKAIGFFEQGLITGATVLLGVFVPTLAYGTWMLGRKGWELTMRSRSG